MSDGTDDEEDGPGIRPSTRETAVTTHLHPSSGESAAMVIDHGENLSLPDTDHTQGSTHNSSPKSYLPVSANISDIEYEFAAMDLFINAKSRGICRRKVMDEYFSNDKIRKLTLLYVSHLSC